MFGAEELSPEGRRRVYRILCHLAHCDGQVAAPERALLEGWRTSAAIAPEEARRLEEQGRAGHALELVDEERERAILVRGLVRLVASDRTLAPAESQRLELLAEQLGLERDALTGAVLDRLMGPPR